MGRDRASTHKMDYVAQAQDILNIKGNQNCIIALVQQLQQFFWTGIFCLLIELNREGSMPATCTAGLLADLGEARGCSINTVVIHKSQ